MKEILLADLLIVFSIIYSIVLTIGGKLFTSQGFIPLATLIVSIVLSLATVTKVVKSK